MLILRLKFILFLNIVNLKLIGYTLKWKINLLQLELHCLWQVRAMGGGSWLEEAVTAMPSIPAKLSAPEADHEKHRKISVHKKHSKISVQEEGAVPSALSLHLRWS